MQQALQLKQVELVITIVYLLLYPLLSYRVVVFCFNNYALRRRYVELSFIFCVKLRCLTSLQQLHVKATNQLA